MLALRAPVGCLQRRSSLSVCTQGVSGQSTPPRATVARGIDRPAGVPPQHPHGSSRVMPTPDLLVDVAQLWVCHVSGGAGNPWAPSGALYPLPKGRPMIVSAYNGALYRALNGLSCSMTEPAVSWWAWPCQRRADTVIGAERCQQIQERGRCRGCPYYQQGAAYVRPLWESDLSWWEWAVETKGGEEAVASPVQKAETPKATQACRRLGHNVKGGRCLTCKGRFASGKTITAQYSER